MRKTAGSMRMNPDFYRYWKGGMRRPSRKNRKCEVWRRSRQLCSQQRTSDIEWNRSMNRKENGGCMQAESKNQSEKLWKIIAFTGLLLCAGLAVWGYQSGYFHSADSLQKFIMQFGGFGMALFIAVQIVQVVFPILPGGISCLAGVMLYGPWIGFFCNYVGICIGSMAAFAIARNLGRTAFEKKCEKERCRKCGTASGADAKRDRSPDCHKLERSGCGTHQHCFSGFSAGSR